MKIGFKISYDTYMILDENEAKLMISILNRVNTLYVRDGYGQDANFFKKLDEIPSIMVIPENLIRNITKEEWDAQILANGEVTHEND